MEGLYKPPEAPPMRDGANAHLTLPSRSGDVLSEYKPPVYMSAGTLEPASSYKALRTKKQTTALETMSFKRNPETQEQITMSTKKTAAATPATPAAPTATLPPGVVTVTKGTIQKRINPAAYAEWLSQRQPGDVVTVEPEKFESIKGHLARYARANNLPWRITGQTKCSDGMCKIGIEAKV